MGLKSDPCCTNKNVVKNTEAIFSKILEGIPRARGISGVSEILPDGIYREVLTTRYTHAYLEVATSYRSRELIGNVCLI